MMVVAAWLCGRFDDRDGEGCCSVLLLLKPSIRYDCSTTYSSAAVCGAVFLHHGLILFVFRLRVKTALVKMSGFLLRGHIIDR